MLNEKARSIFQFVFRYSRDHGYPPTIREIGDEFGIRSTNGTRYYISILEREGYLRRIGKRKSRTLEIPETGLRRYLRHHGDPGLGTESVEGAEGIPILGRVAAGTPLLAEENLEGHVDLDGSFPSSGPRFALRVRGDSMRDAGILEDDLVIVRRTEHAENGEIVVALLGDEATVKRLRRRAGGVELVPENARYRPIQVEPGEELRILGVMIGLVRPARSARRRVRSAG